ncbi:MAG: response regulator [Bdellovibrionales bacterium]
MFPDNTKILIVDDMLMMRKLVQKSCKDIGFSDFILASDGDEAWKILNENADSIGLVISDWNMPNLTGLAFLKQVRADAKLKDVPFVLLTAESEAAQVAEAIQAGVDNYIVKPFNVVTLKEKLEQTYKKIARRLAA